MPLRWGVAGYGDVVRCRALPALKTLGQRVRALWGRDGPTALALANAHGIPLGTADFHRLIEHVDAVYIATPVVSHVPLAVIAAAAGKHVLVEKPLAGSLSDAVDLDRIATARAVRAGVAYYRRLAPSLLYLREVLQPERLERIEIRFRMPFDPSPDDPKHWRTERAAAGGGVLSDAGSHRLDLLCWLLGSPHVTRAHLAYRFPGGCERQARVGLHWPSGAKADLEFDWRSGAPQDSLTFHTDTEVIALDPLDGGVVRWLGDETRSRSFPVPENPHVALFADFIRSIETREQPVCPLGDALRVDELLREAERMSSLTHRD